MPQLPSYELLKTRYQLTAATVRTTVNTSFEQANISRETAELNWWGRGDSNPHVC